MMMAKAPPNNSFNRSGDSVPFIIFPALRLAWIRAAALIRALDLFP